MRRPSNSRYRATAPGRDAVARHCRDRFPTPDRRTGTSACSTPRHHRRTGALRRPRAVVIIAVRVVVVVGAAVIAVARPDADAGADRNARPEAAATVVTITATVIAATAASIIIPPDRRRSRRVIHRCREPGRNPTVGACRNPAVAPPIEGAPPPPALKPPPPPPPPPALKPPPPPPALEPMPCAEPVLGATIGKSSAIAAAVLKTFRLIIVGSICGI